MDNKIREGDRKLSRYLSPMGAWALALGCSVGWGAFMMPGTTFLPIAGPLGSVLGIVIGGVIMLIIGVNYHYLMNHYPDSGGTYTYTKLIFGYDHGFLNAWFLILTYVAIIWANATAIPLIGRNLLGGMFQLGGHYEIAEFEVYMGEVALAIAALLIAAWLCIYGKPAVWIQTFMALVLCAGVLIGLFSVLRLPGVAGHLFSPPFSPEKTPVSGTFTIIALAPWAYVGFESISHSTREFRFSPKKSFFIMAAAVLAAASAYAILAVMAGAVLPEGCDTWADYIMNLRRYEGIEGLPTFYAAESAMGQAGAFVLACTTFGAITTGLIGNYICSSRLLYTLAEDDLIPAWFGRLNRKNVPQNAILFIMGISVFLPFFGRTAISWIVDVTTVGATIAYAYTSAAALKEARRREDKLVTVTAVTGLVLSLVFVLYFLVPSMLAVTALSTESYLILASWGILGFFVFLHLFKADKARRLGRSVVVWVVLLALIIFTSSVWMRQTTEYAYLHRGVSQAGDVLTRNLFIQTILIVTALAILFYIYSLMQKREKQMEVEKALAEDSNRAKTSFLSNMSHEIRTPMNAIIGLGTIALKDPDLPPRTRVQLEKIDSSARHLLGLINDILDMSRIESGRMVLKEEEFRFKEFLEQINIIANGQCSDKGLTYECKIVGNTRDYYIGDDLKLKQVLINILGNAVKFTDAGGSVFFTVEQMREFEGYNTLRFTIRDTGIGMSKEYIPKIFDAFSQENDSTTNKYGSTGLGMSITKSIVEMMNGDIKVDSEKGVGTTFTVTVTLKASSRDAQSEQTNVLPEKFSMLIVDDDEVAGAHAQLVAGAIGIKADISATGEEAIDRIRTGIQENRPYDLVLTDYKMPGIDGIELTREIREIDDGKTAVIVLTGYNWDDMQKEAEEAGVDGVLGKPLFTDSLTREIQNVLLRRGFGAEERKEDASGELQQDAGGSEPVIDKEINLEGLHMLVAEDMEINADILMDLLEMEGMTADHAENGQLAIDMFAASPENHYDAVLMDIRMPVLDGLGATRGIRALDRPDAKTVPIIAMTANAFDEDVQKSLQAGMNAHISKPVDADRLYETLEKLVLRKEM